MAGTPGSYGPRGGQPANDLYTALVVIATGCIAFALGYVIYKAIELFGSLPSFDL